MVSPSPRPAPSARSAGCTARGAEHAARGGRCAGAQTTPVCWRQTSLRARRRRRAGPRLGCSGCRASRPRPPRPRAARYGLCPCARRPRHAQRSAGRAEAARRRQGAGTVAVTRIPLAGRRGRASPPGAAQTPGGAVPASGLDGPASGLDELPRGGLGSLPLSLDAPRPARLDALVSPRADAPAGASPPPAAAASGPAGSAAAPVSPGAPLGGSAGGNGSHGAPYARSPGMPRSPAATPGGTARGSPWQGGGLDAAALGGAGEDPDDGSGGAPAHVYNEEPEEARSAAHAGRLIAEELLYRCAPARSAGPSVPRAGHFSIIFIRGEGRGVSG
jgi:hypothetical protein